MTDYRCPRCGRSVATTNGVDIAFNGDIVPNSPIRIVFPCPYEDCEGRVHWVRSSTSNGKVLASRYKM
jgi:hypothetical protein